MEQYFDIHIAVRHDKGSLIHTGFAWAGSNTSAYYHVLIFIITTSHNANRDRLACCCHITACDRCSSAHTGLYRYLMRRSLFFEHGLHNDSRMISDICCLIQHYLIVFVRIYRSCVFGFFHIVLFEAVPA